MKMLGVYYIYIYATNKEIQMHPAINMWPVKALTEEVLSNWSYKDSFVPSYNSVHCYVIDVHKIHTAVYNIFINGHQDQ